MGGCDADGWLDGFPWETVDLCLVSECVDGCHCWNEESLGRTLGTNGMRSLSCFEKRMVSSCCVISSITNTLTLDNASWMRFTPVVIAISAGHHHFRSYDHPSFFHSGFSRLSWTVQWSSSIKTTITDKRKDSFRRIVQTVATPIFTVSEHSLPFHRIGVPHRTYFYGNNCVPNESAFMWWLCTQLVQYDSTTIVSCRNGFIGLRLDPCAQPVLFNVHINGNRYIGQ